MIFIFLIYLFSCANCGHLIDVNDILDTDLMPGNLLVLENSDSQPNKQNSSVPPISNVVAGTFNEAYSTMGFHRTKMNEYLCRSFVADQILTEMSLTRIKRRLGAAAESPKKTRYNIETADIKDKLLYDEGSSNYKQWLTQSTTLEDIYRHYEHANKKSDLADVNVDLEEEEGVVPSYVLGYPQLSHKAVPTKLTSAYAVHEDAHAGYEDEGYGTTGHHGYEFTPQHIHYYPTEHYEEDKEKGGKELVLTDLVEIALTAIAFISFGCFILQVIMCIGATNNTAQALPMSMMPMVMPTTGGGPVEGGDVEPISIIGRFRRETRHHYTEAINELSRRVLRSIDAAFVAVDDDGGCLRRKLCEDNRFSRSMDGRQKLWIPVWSFGMSWLSGRLISNTPPSTSMLESLKASILGLGNANCELLYNCNLKQLRDNQRRRRKRRST